MNTGPRHTGNAPDDERETLAQKLSEAMKENKVLHDRLAELDISMNIETVELKKDIEALERERDDLTKENESLLEDYTAKDHTIQDLLRQLEIKQLMISETSSYLSTATDRIKNLEKQCSSLEAQSGELAKPERGSKLLEDIRKEFEETLEQRDSEIETLNRNMEQLQEQNKFLAEEKAEIEKDRSEMAETPAPLENSLMEMEHSLLGLEQRISRATEISVTEKEEILEKLDDAHREIFSLREYHRSLLEALRKTDEEARKDVFSLSDFHQSILDSLKAKEQEHAMLQAEMAHTIGVLQEKDTTISGLGDQIEQERQLASSSMQELREKLNTAEERIIHLASELTLEKSTQSGLQEAIQNKDVILREMHEHFIAETQSLQAALTEAKEAAEREKNEIRRLETTAARTDATIELLTARLTEQQSISEAKNREAAELAEKNHAFEEENQRLGRASEDYMSALQVLQAALSEAKEAVDRDAEEIAGLKTSAAQSNAAIEALNAQITEQQSISEAKSREAAELAEKCHSLEEDNQRLGKASEDYIAALQNTIGLKDDELEILVRRKEELETALSNASNILAQQENLKAEAEKISLQQAEIGRLRLDNKALSEKLAEAVQKTEILEEIKTAVSSEVNKLSEKMESLQDTGAADRAALRNDIDRSFSIIAAGTERLEHAIADGLPLVKKLEDISAEILKGEIPAVYTAVPQEPEENRGRTYSRKAVAFLGFLLLLLTAAIFFRADINRAFFDIRRSADSPKQAVWEAGMKQAKNSQYETTLTFLTKEAVQVLGFSDIIAEAALMHTTFALIEIRSTGGCIPEEFVASPEKNITFIDSNGKDIPLNDPGALAGWKKTVYKQNACSDSRAGTIYMKHIISAAKGPEFKGLKVRGLGSETILLQ